MDINNLECFIAVAEELSISKAARKMFITQQTMSSIIQRLEAEYSTQLFERRPVFKLTPAGEQMLAYGRGIREQYEQMQLAMEKADEKKFSSTLKIGMPQARVDAFFYDIWEKFHRLHPDVRIEIHDGRSRALQKDVMAGKLNLCMGLSLEASSGLNVLKFVKEDGRIVISRRLLQQYHPELTELDYLRMVREGIPYALLDGVPAIQESVERGRESEFDEHLAAAIRKNLLLWCAHQSTVYAMAKRGAGYGIVFPFVSYTRKEEINQPGGDMWVFPADFQTIQLEFGAAWSSEVPLPEYAADFISIAEEVIRPYTRFIVDTRIQK